MRKQKQHKRFTISMSNDLSLAGCYWYAQDRGNFVPVANLDNSKNIRPLCVHV